jgi:hypothetical protein
MTGSIIMLAVVLIMAGCAVFLFLKGTFIKAFAMAIAAVCASTVALGFYAILANTLVNFSGNSDLLTKWGPLLCFVLLFIVVFAVLQTIINLLSRQPIDLGLWPERVGRVACGVFLGFTLSRVLFAVLIMSLLPGLQTSSMGKYLGYKGFNPPKHTQPQQVGTKSRQAGTGQRESSTTEKSKSTSERKKLSDTSKSVLGPDFE